MHAITGVITRRGGVPCILTGGSGLRLDQACRDLHRLRLGRTLGLLRLLSALRVLGLPGLLGLCLLRLSPFSRLDRPSISLGLGLDGMLDVVGFDVGDAGSSTLVCPLVSMPTSTLASKTTRTTRMMRMAFLFFMACSC